MRTTMNLKEEVYIQLKHLALTAGRPMGDVASELMEAALAMVSKNARKTKNTSFELPVLPVARGRGVVTDDFVNQLREQEGI